VLLPPSPLLAILIPPEENDLRFNAIRGLEKELTA